jgi:hypothetical protein
MAVALAIHLGVYCAVAACFALALYYLMQPARLPNPGMAAYKPSPSTTGYAALLRAEREAAKRGVKVELEPETTGAAAPQAPDVKPDAKKAKAQGRTSGQSRTRPARRPQPAEPTIQPAEPTTFAQQPFFSGHRPMYYTNPQ